MVIHLASPQYHKVVQEGNPEEAKRLYDEGTEVEKTVLRVGVTIATGVFFLAAGLSSYLYGLGAATGLSIGLDSKVRKNITEGNFGEAANLTSYHMPFVGLGRRMWEVTKQGDSLGILFLALFPKSLMVRNL